MQATGKAQNTGLTPQQAFAQAEQLLKAGRVAESEAICHQILAQRPRFHPALFHLGMIAVHRGRLRVAADLVGRAVGVDQSVAGYHKALGEIYRRLGKSDVAISAGMQAVKLNPRDAGAHYNLGLALTDAGKLSEADKAYRKALEMDPRYGAAANNLGALLEKHLKNQPEAKKYYALAVEINPRHAEAQNNLGAVLSEEGDLDGAKACFAAAVDANPSFIHAHYNLSALKKYKPADPHLGAMEAMLAQIESMPAETRVKFWFAIAKAWEDVGRYDESFDAYHRANKLQRSTFEYDVKRTIGVTDDIIRKFDKEFLHRNQGKGYFDDTPIFIVGMPRSGTTLIEQILSSHSEVFGAGELRDFIGVMEEKTGKTGAAACMDVLNGAGAEMCSEMGKRYIDKIRKYAPTAGRITDKMPGNFFNVGIIHLALPQAKFIYSRRDPMDICLSNYTKLFVEHVPFAYDLEELGHYYHCCRRLMEHWQSVLPPGTILDFKYEDVVENFGTKARELVEFCGLEWQDACLDFHKNERLVKTASIAQVRTPIYKSSVAKWRRYSKQLEPLRVIIEKEEN